MLWLYTTVATAFFFFFSFFSVRDQHGRDSHQGANKSCRTYNFDGKPPTGEADDGETSILIDTRLAKADTCVFSDRWTLSAICKCILSFLIKTVMQRLYFLCRKLKEREGRNQYRQDLFLGVFQVIQVAHDV